jgi:hypothetical protein
MDHVRTVGLAEQSQFAEVRGRNALVFSGDAEVLDSQLLIRIVVARHKADLAVDATANAGNENEAAAEGFVCRASHWNKCLDLRERGSSMMSITRKCDVK